MTEPDDTFDDHDDDVDDSAEIERYGRELVAAADAFGVPIPTDFPADELRR